jgi:hypothetical protein
MKHFLLSEHVHCLVAAHNEALKKELQRLLYQQQHQLPPLSPPGYELQRQQFSMLDLGSQHQQQQQQQQQQQPQLRPLSPIP